MSKENGLQASEVESERWIECEECTWRADSEPGKPWQHRRAQAHANATGHSRFSLRKIGICFPHPIEEAEVKTGDEVFARCDACNRIIAAGKLNPGFLAKQRAHEKATGHKVGIHSVKLENPK